MPPAQRREQLIDAALQVILDQGYSGVSIEAVAREAGVTRPVVYDHFPTKSALYAEILQLLPPEFNAWRSAPLLERVAAV